MRIFTKIRLWLATHCQGGGLFYINGPDVLPAPLTPEREAECIARLDEEKYRSILVGRCSFCFFYIPSHNITSRKPQ